MYSLSTEVITITLTLKVTVKQQSDAKVQISLKKC